MPVDDHVHNAAQQLLGEVMSALINAKAQILALQTEIATMRANTALPANAENMTYAKDYADQTQEAACMWNKGRD